MQPCNPLRCPNGAACPALAPGRALGDLIPPAAVEKPHGCPASRRPQPTRITVSAGVEWLHFAAA